MNLIQTFSFMRFDIRVVKKDNEPWFVLKDVCAVLALGNPRQVKARLDKDVISNDPLQTKGGIQQATIINEDGLYDVIFESRKPEAKAFRKWVTKDVLPSIRKTGSYSLNLPSYPAEDELQKVEDYAVLHPDYYKYQDEAIRHFKTAATAIEGAEQALLLAQSVATKRAYLKGMEDGKKALPSPQIALPGYPIEDEPFWTATQIAEETGNKAHWVGRIATRYDVKIPEYGHYVLSKAAYSKALVKVFVYNAAGRERLLQVL